MGDVNRFIEYLSWRQRDENDLSDITWSFCEASGKFKEIFLTFIFGKDKYGWNRVVEFQREYSRSSSRPDFFFKNEGVEFIIEVKINNKNQHFDQYNKKETFADAKKGYITNYKLSKHKDYEVKTWTDFSNFLKNERQVINEITKDLLDGYISYLDNVCAIKSIKNMNLKGIESLYHFKNSIDRVIERDNDTFYCTRYSQTDKSYDIRQGRCFQLTLKKEEIKDIWGWIGLYFNDQTIVCIEFDKNEGWGLPVYELLDSCSEHKKGVFAETPYEEDGAYYFELTAEKLHEFEDESNVDKQIEILDSYFVEVLEYIRKKASH